MNDYEITEAVAATFGWQRFRWNSQGKLIAQNPELSDSLNYEVPNYAHDIKAAWQLTQFISISTFRHWPTPREICLAYLKAGVRRAD